MTIEEKLNLIADTLEADHASVRQDTILANLDEWDSLGTISVIAMLDKKFNKVLDAEQIEKLKTVQNILDLMA